MGKSMKIIDEQTGEITGYEVVAQSIERISESIRRLEASRLTAKLIVALVHDNTKISKREIQVVIESLRNLDKTYLKPKKP